MFGVSSGVKYMCKLLCSQTKNFTSAKEETMGFRRIMGNPNGLKSILTVWSIMATIVAIRPS
jgi:hypothetical protein